MTEQDAKVLQATLDHSKHMTAALMLLVMALLSRSFKTRAELDAFAREVSEAYKNDKSISDDQAHAVQINIETMVASVRGILKE